MIIYLRSISLYFKLLIIRNKISSPEDFNFTRFDCILISVMLIPTKAANNDLNPLISYK